MGQLREADLDGTTLRAAFGAFPSGIVAVCGMADGAPVGMVVSTFVPVSLDPPLVAFCVQHSSTTWPRLRGLPRLGISVLGEAHDVAARTLSARTGDRFAELHVDATADGAVLIEGCGAHVVCTVHDEVSAGDHAIVVLRVHGLQTAPEVAPLVFHASAFRSLRPVA